MILHRSSDPRGGKVPEREGEMMDGRRNAPRVANGESGRDGGEGEREEERGEESEKERTKRRKGGEEGVKKG